MVRQMIEEKVKAFLDEGVSLKQISKYSGVHYTTLSKWLNGDRKMSKKNEAEIYFALEKIAATLNEIME